MKKGVPKTPSAEDPLPVEEMTTDKRFADMGSASLNRDPEGLVGTAATGSRNRVTDKMTALRPGSDATNATVEGVESRLSAQMAGMESKTDTLLATIAGRQKGDGAQGG